MRDKEPSPSRCDPNLRPGFISRPPAMWRWWILLMLLLVPAGVPGEPSLPIPLQTRTFFTEWGSAAPRGQQPVCLDIPSNLSLCYGVGYRQMRLPNLLEHDTMAEVGQQAASWVPLVNIRCHGDAQLFLCSLFSPVCLDRPIYPCRSLCEQVRRGCEGRMRAHGYPWPDMFRCDKFPRDNDMCISSQSDPQPQPQGPETSPDSAEEHVVENANDECRPCKQVDTYENVLDNICRADFAVRAKLRGRAGRGAGRGAHARGARARGHRGSQPHSDGDLRTARVLKAAGPVVRKMVRDALPALPPPSACPACAHEPHSYLVMGSVGPDKELRITFVLPWTTKSRAIKKAVRTFTNTNCSNPNLVSRTVIVDTYTPIEFGGMGNPLPPIQLPPTIVAAATTTTTTAAAPTTSTTSTTSTTTTTTTTPIPETTTMQAPSPPPRPSRPAGRNRGNGARNRQNGQNPYRSRRPDALNEVQGVHLTRGSHVTTPSSGDFFDGHMHRHRRPDAGSPLWHNRPQSRSTSSPSTSTHTTTYTPTTPTESTTTIMTSTTIMPFPITNPPIPNTVEPTSSNPTTTSLTPTTTPSTTTSSSPAPTTTSTTSTTSLAPTTTSTTSTTTSLAPTTTSTTSTTTSLAPTTTSTITSTTPTTTSSRTSTITSTTPTTTSSTTSPAPTTTPYTTTSSTELTPMTTTTMKTTTTANDVWSRWAVPTRATSAYLPPWMTTTSTAASPTSHYRSHTISTRWYPSPWRTSSTTSTTSSWSRESGTQDWYTQRSHLASESSTGRTTSGTSLYHSIRREPVFRSSTYSPTLSKYWETAVITSTGEGSYGETESVSTTPSRAWSSAVTPSTTYRYQTEAPTTADRSSSTHSSTTSTEAVPRPRRPTTSDWWLPQAQSTTTWRPPATEQAASSRKSFKGSPPSSPRPRHKQRRPKNRRRMKQRQPTREGEIPLPKTLVNLFERA